MDIEAEAKKQLIFNRRESEGYQYTLPSAEHYPYQWLWDSCFHAIMYARFDPDAGKKELQSLLSRQLDTGMIPHIIYWTPGILHLFRWGLEGTSSLTQPPMIAYAALEVYRASADKPFLESIYPSMMLFYRYLLEKRDPMQVGLAGIINPDESGEDNSPRFDGVLGCETFVSYKDHRGFRERLVDHNRENNFNVEVCMRESFWVQDVLFNTVLVENLHALARIAAILGDEAGGEFARKATDRAAAAMHTHMFEEGVYWSFAGTAHRKLKVHTWTHFLPLFAGLYSKEEAAHVIEKYFKDEETFRAPWGMRTVSKKERAYRGEGYAEGFSWRGPVWHSPQWFVYRGLKRYGYDTEAAWLREKSRALLEHAGFRECFNPETGEGLGAKGFTWGALILDMQD